ncbi:Peptidase family M28 [Tenacibaculum sp. MAR_2009_124]|uniref:M28 family peptidase n=1 Tax=Tenacibaculum sp. MAR_2009_124 TaxID=1250059 RepID=UPI0008959A38|nr:M28 family peptidase [Tenacibaculum sp. MAR_2009_124]SEB75978.1 Peptidase family M28 [Tenacibaculum sp. MAR_2009_124]
MKKTTLIFSTLLLTLLSCKQIAQTKSEEKPANIENENSLKAKIESVIVKKHLYALSSDEMQGRKPGTEGMEKATKYIENEYKRIGLKTFKDLNSYRQNFIHDNIEMSNIIGMLEGSSKKDEFVIVSAHHDHLGMKKDGEGDLIFNGANDDASGVVGVLSLAEYYAQKGNNERSILFVCFTAEEIGLVGSNYFGKNIDPEQFVAGINLELIGKQPKTGPKTAWLTGFNRSDFGKIIQKNLKGTDYQLFPDPYTKFNLFFRSDNASLAKLGVPSHTFSTTSIDTDEHYHKVSDEAETLNIQVLTETVKAVAKGTESIIKGTDTPTRIKLTE